MTRRRPRPGISTVPRERPRNAYSNPASAEAARAHDIVILEAVKGHQTPEESTKTNSYERCDSWGAGEADSTPCLEQSHAGVCHDWCRT